MLAAICFIFVVLQHSAVRLFFSIFTHTPSVSRLSESNVLTNERRLRGTTAQWLKLSCEARGGGSPDEARLKQTPYPFPHLTNLALFGHKITLYRFNQGGSYHCKGLKSEHGLSPPLPPHFNHCHCMSHSTPSHRFVSYPTRSHLRN